MKTRVKDKVMVPLSSYVSAQNKYWLSLAAKKNGQKMYQFLDQLISEARKKGA